MQGARYFPTLDARSEYWQKRAPNSLLDEKSSKLTTLNTPFSLSPTSLPWKESNLLQKKIDAIINMAEPQDKKGVQRLLGMVNYVSKFVPNVSEITSPLQKCLKKMCRGIGQ